MSGGSSHINKTTRPRKERSMTNIEKEMISETRERVRQTRETVRGETMCALLVLVLVYSSNKLSGNVDQL